MIVSSRRSAIVLLLVLAICQLSFAIPGGRELLSAGDVQEAAEDAAGHVWGGSCSTESQCVQYLSYCSSAGECRLVWWVWLILAIILFLIICCCLSCICLPCCCLYNCCSTILDCLCCCCSGKRSRGYSPASTG